ncbi:choline dehydrogenase [Fibrisoma montanum]|uniref:Choline dehydrogenase n=1 Tax=Fibrisoma montanum TaxID=2305895 RepID=A0A418LYB7_9BACT|nr:choline dehydrogenase [Fibrisoma montanum]RIV18298.1 choline dehydrogenase [Fibrisoma montanum]
MKFDYIIIGAGSAGCVLANRLSADPAISVLVLEAGGPDKQLEIHIPAGYAKLHGSAVDWGYWTEPQPDVDGRRMYQPRGKTLGGCSSTNAMAYVRGNRLDYDDWASFGNTGWGYDDVLPYFIRSEHNEQITQLDSLYHGQHGPLNVTFAQQYRTVLATAFVDACEQSGIRRNPDYNGAQQEGAGYFQFTIKNARRHSAATAFLKPALKRPNLTVITHAHTHRVVIRNGRATGVDFLTGKNTTETAEARREVIVSAGAFNSPQILMLSGIGPADTLRRYGIDVIQDLPGVGQNLQDHLFTGVSSLCTQPVSSNSVLKPLNQFKALMQYLLSRKGPMTIGPLEANAFLTLDSAADRPNMQFQFAPVHLGDDYSGDMYDMATYPTTDGYTILPTLLKPKSVGNVSIRSANPLDAPLIDPRYLSHEDDQRVLVEGVKKAVEVMQAAPFGPYCRRLQTPSDRSSDEAILVHIRKQLEAVYHPVGTCKMGPDGPSDPMAVVDPALRVRGVEGLRVADASIMPTIVSGNTNAPVIMIGEKAADLILGLRPASSPATSVMRAD